MAKLGHIPATCGGTRVAAFLQGWFSSAVPPSDATTGLQDSSCYWVRELAWPSLGETSFQECPCLTWPLLVSHVRAQTAQNPIQSAPSLQLPGEQPWGAALSAAGSPTETPSQEEPDPRVSFVWGIQLSQLKEQDWLTC